MTNSIDTARERHDNHLLDEFNGDTPKKYKNTPEYGDWLLEQEKDRRMEDKWMQEQSEAEQKKT